MNLLHTAHVPAGEGPFPTILALHGWGASAHDLLGLAPMLPKDTLMISPQGRVELEIAPGMKGYGWFRLVPGQPPDVEAFKRASEGLGTFSEEMLQRFPCDPGKVVALGFSQGGVMGFDLALRSPKRFAGLVALSTWLPEMLATDFSLDPDLRGFPVLMLHGRQDAMIEAEKARKSKDILEAMGVDLTYQEFDMGHEISRDALATLVEWLEATIRPSKS